MNSENINWVIPHERLSLSKGEIHIWKIALDDPALKPEDLYNDILSEDERERADRFRFSEYGNRFIAARACLRKILGTYCNTKPSDIVFEYNEHGKPGIPEGSNLEEIQFNLSHSGDLALCAITKERAVGIDIEFLRQVTRPEKILERFFSDRERAYYYSQPESMKIRAFLKLWTIKEALSKALGTGFSSQLKEIDLSPALESSFPARASISQTNDSGIWSILQITPCDGYLGGLAYRGGAKQIRYFLARSESRREIVP